MAASYQRTSVPGIYRRGNRYSVGYTDPSGRRRKRSAATMAEARRLKASLATDVARGDYRELSDLRFDEYAREWVRTYQGRTGRGIREATLEEYRRDLELDPIPFFGRTRLAEIEPRHIKALAKHIADRGVAPATVRTIMAPVRALFATAAEEGLIRSNPCAGIRLAGRRSVVTDELPDTRRALTEEELARIIAETPEEWRLFVRFLAQTGVRIGEAIALRWGDVDLGARRVKVRRRIYKGKVDVPKSRYGIRDIPISTALAQDLWRWRAASGNPADEAPLFPSKTGTHLNGENLLGRFLKPAVIRAGVPWAGFHTLRHTCASMLFRAGWNAKQVQVVLGHHSPAFTLATYVHLISEDLPEPQFPDVLTGPPPTADTGAESAEAIEGLPAPQKRP
ncbi:tyrosine-type recombinase/integrase [Miltoncostaea marina]|uniref:tyrosine-type recombinase/integrase n=1 Tax=Miltoncostaea marina TaxID=2843215 RepID=UPI001C3DD0DD|nr:site-specific integrase [Miltoncostaea marina]